MIVDLLVHLETEDGDLEEPEALMNTAKTVGLDAMVLVQSGALVPDLEPYRAAAESAGIRLFPGAELVTDRGHILALLPEGAALEPGFAPEVEAGVWSATEAVDAVEAKGGAAVALRPYDRELSWPMGDHLFSLQGLDACEVRSGKASDIANDLALEAASNLEMPCVGTSGADGTEGLGETATLLRRPVTDAAGLIAIIKAGECWPVTFRETLPPEVRDERRGRGGGDRNRGRDRRGAGGGGRGRSDDRGGRRRRGGGGRGRDERGRSGGRGRSDDVGNRAPRDENTGPGVPDDIGNRRSPGESSPYHDALRGDDEA